MILIKKPEERLLNLEEILQAFQIWFPQGLNESIENFTLGIYSQKTGNKIFLVAKTKEWIEIENLIINWQKKLENEGVYLAGTKIATLTNKFQKITYGGQEIKFLTISRQDKGICYSLVKPYFIFAGSLEATKKIIDQIK